MSSGWIPKKATGEPQEEHNGWLKVLVLTWTVLDFTLKQSSDADNGFVNLILDQTQGFTHAGVERLNDSIRTYVWAILEAQAEERTPILGSGTAITAQKKFLENISTAIQQAEETSVTKYQNVLQYARS